jgi:hypothetical protein
MIVVEGGDSSGISVSKLDPAVSIANEEASGPPAESVRLERKSTISFNRVFILRRKRYEF